MGNHDRFRPDNPKDVIPSGPDLSVLCAGYARGCLGLHQIADALKIPPGDAVALLEKAGYVRSLNVIRLTESDRKRILERMRSDRLARNGNPAPSDALVDRDVIASQRIAAIDARPWLRKTR